MHFPCIARVNDYYKYIIDFERPSVISLESSIFSHKFNLMA